jgi:hypothetical protein
MKSEKIRTLLERPSGYEVAEELIDSKKSFTELKSNLDTNSDYEIYRIIEKGEDIGIIEIPLTRGGKKYTLNTELLTEDQLKEIQLSAYHRENDTEKHQDISNTKSMFKRDLSSDVDITYQHNSDSKN